MPIVSMTIGSDVFSVYKSDITTMPVLFEDSSVKYREY